MGVLSQKRKAIGSNSSANSNGAAIVLEFAGGLGNQLFQCMCAQYIETRTARQVLFDCTAVYRDIKRDLLIEQLNWKNRYFIRTKKELFSILGCRVYNSLSTSEKIIHKIWPYVKPENAKSFLLIDDDILSAQYLSLETAQNNSVENAMEQYVEKIISLINTHEKKVVYVRGYWQYYFFYQKNTAQGLTLPMCLVDDGQNRDASINIPSSVHDSVDVTSPRDFVSCSVHVRRGDYLDSSVQNMLPSLDIEYYKNAMCYMKEKYQNCRFYIFSDDPLWCTDVLLHELQTHLDLDNIYVLSAGEIYEHTAQKSSEPTSGNRTIENKSITNKTHTNNLATAIQELLDSKKENISFGRYDMLDPTLLDLLLMNACTQHILANSSFSWWGAMFLSQTAQKDITRNTHSKETIEQITIAPRRWFAKEIKNLAIKPSAWVEM